MKEIAQVVPLAGHVDRNFPVSLRRTNSRLSCPSRGTWIEMLTLLPAPSSAAVVPLTGHVDRNIAFYVIAHSCSRRAPPGARG